MEDVVVCPTRGNAHTKSEARAPLPEDIHQARSARPIGIVELIFGHRQQRGDEVAGVLAQVTLR